ncbi:MAG: type III-A CRISPR-associated RAMP protein Csm3 [Bacteroidales bacterium]|jgi:CRISPR-associated protein Csm3|nr:type III-A CRISPR-associated RAMP protein Csm3 [Bacteroidales bacterium]MCI2133513.1 type III-A CRISPR-associated RAMP protein Csm3 [Bacteroidales bacterium]
MTKLIKKIIYTGQIKLITGLHIGGSNTAMNIGGPDNFVVRNPLNNLPYIPGSSLKGKLRSLCELYNNEIDAKGDVSSNPNGKAGSLFGTSADNDKGHASRLIVRDAELDTSDDKQFANTELPYTETKTEASINRITSKANPRTFERVPAGAKFNFEMVLNIFEGEDENTLINTLKQAMRLLEDDYLGGNGSRGYGKIKFTQFKEDSKTNY